MSCRSRLFSMLAAVTAFCKSLKFKTIFSSSVCRPRSRKPQSTTPPKIQRTFCVDMDGNNGRPTDIESPFPDNATGIAPRDLGTTDFPSQETSSVLVEGSDSTSSMGYGSQIAEGAWLEGNSKDLATPSPDILYTPLSPPPSHRNSRKADVIVGPDDFTHSDVVLCSEHSCFPCSQCAQGEHRQKEPLRFPF